MLLASAMIFGISALAADFSLDDAITYTDGAETVTVNLYAGENVTTLDQYSAIELGYDDAVFSFNSATTTQPKSSAIKSNTLVAVTYSNIDGDITVDKAAPLMTVVFNVVDPSKVVGSKFEVLSDLSMMTGDNWGIIYDLSDVSVTVTAGKPASNVSATIDGDGVITVSGDSELAGKNIVVSEKTCSNVTPNTRVKVTIDGAGYKIFGENMWDEAGMEGPGSVYTKTVAFGVIFSGDYVADDFTFEIIDDITTYVE